MPPRTRKGLQQGPDLPGLFPTHDGSYGVNTLINDPKKGHRPNSGIVDESEDDREWVKSMKGKIGKKYGMNSDLKKAIDESHKEVEEEERQVHAPNARDTHHPPNLDRPASSGSSSSSNPRKFTPSPDLSDGVGGIIEADGESGQEVHPSDPSDPSDASDTPDSSDTSEPDFPTVPKLPPHAPRYNPNNLPFSEDYPNLPRPPYNRGALSSSGPDVDPSIYHYISPPSEDIPFYGIPQGEGSKMPITTRQPTTRSFEYENSLFVDAILRSPRQPTSLNETFQPAAQSLDPPIRNQTDEHLDFMEKPSIAQREPVTFSTPPYSDEQSSSGGLSLQGGSILGQSGTDWPPNSVVQPPSQNLSDHAQSKSLPRAPHAEKHLNGAVSKHAAPRKQPLGGSTQEPEKRKITWRTSTESRSNMNRRRGWVWPSPDLIIRSVALFSVLALVLWYTLSAIPGVLNDSDPETWPPLTRFSLPNFNIGAVWEAVSDLLPEMPVISHIPYYPSRNTAGGPGSWHKSDINFDEILAELKKRMPESIWVQTDKSGKLKIPEDFWHALKGLIKEDGSLLKPADSQISEDHLRAMIARIQGHGSSTPNTSTKEMETFVEESISRSWDSWMKQNNGAIKKELTGLALTREDFIKLFRQEITSYQGEIREELATLEGRVKSVTQQLSKLRNEFRSTHQITQEAITRSFDSILAKTVNNLKLDAVAQGFIKGHVNDVLVNQINFFGIGSGLAIDPEFSSSAWEPRSHRGLLFDWLDSSGYTAQPRMAAFSPWTQEGECFCAGVDRYGRYGWGTNNLTVLTARDIIPQHFVVEHIMPGATLDPGAMPKEIELWGEFEDLNLRNELRYFTAEEFPGELGGHPPQDGFVKIGHFTYENKTTGDGVQVFKISDQLTRMGAMSSRFLIRALNNYGADHTCFYRLRLYGEIVERHYTPI